MPHTGGGGGGDFFAGSPNHGGSGVVIIRYKIDSDGDGIGNADEGAAGTSPNDASSRPVPVWMRWTPLLARPVASIVWSKT